MKNVKLRRNGDKYNSIEAMEPMGIEECGTEEKRRENAVKWKWWINY